MEMDGKTDRESRRELTFTILTAMKFLLPVLYAVLSLRLLHKPQCILLVCAETLLVFLFTNIVASWSRIVAWLLGVIFLFTIYAQTLVMYFTGSYVQLIMLTNLDSVEALRGKAVLYIGMIVITLVVLLLPIAYIKIPHVKYNVLIMCLLFAGFCWIPIVGSDYSPYRNAYALIEKYEMRIETEERIRAIMDDDSTDCIDEFYSETVGDGIDRPRNLPSDPNVVLIFTEGLSRHIVTDERGIMPNVAKYMENGLSFENYYDHTAATFRGLIGQLYSSHQLMNGDTNLLISLEDIFRNKGYETTFVNPEPDQELFTDYLDSLGFDTLTSGGITDEILTDGQTYDLVFESLRTGAQTGHPQFVAAYTFGTHVGNDSPDIVFEDGSNILLNRFYYCDAMFGRFMDELHESGLAENTVVIFTSDHASYVDDDYILSFYPDYTRFDIFCDTIPLIIYYEGIEPETIDAGGRNSLDLAPTILDYLDIDSPNYFLGTSLFLPMNNPDIETVFCVPDSDWFVKTDEDELRNLTEEEAEDYMDIIERYLSLTRRTENPVL